MNFPDLLLIAGLATVCVGAGLIFTPLGLMVFGLTLAVCAVLLAPAPGSRK